MKTWERFLLVMSLLAISVAALTLVFEWKKDSDVWRSLKKAALEKDLLNFKSLS